MTRLIVPFTHEDRATTGCLKAAGIEPERIYVGDDPTAYWRVMRDAWEEGEDFIVCEHDEQFERRHIDGLHDCEREWCTAGQEFQLTRWRGSLMRAKPDAFDRLLVPYRHWWALAWAFIGAMSEDGYTEHRHGAPWERAVNRRSTYIDPVRTEEWKSWLRTIPNDVPDFSAPLGRRGEMVSWREWAWGSGLPPGANWPCTDQRCKRGYGGRVTCPNCIDHPLTVIRDGTGTLINADGTRRWPNQ